MHGEHKTRTHRVSLFAGDDTVEDEDDTGSEEDEDEVNEDERSEIIFSGENSGNIEGEG